LQLLSDSIDIAILRLFEDAPMSEDVYPALLPSDNLDQFVERKVQIGGWGKDSKESTNFGVMTSHIPTFAEARVVSTSECSQIWFEMSSDDSISEKFICTEVANGHGQTHGDSGGISC
jgi:hypothetical protein